MLANSFKNNDSLDCPICFNETNGLKMTYHEYMKFSKLWNYKKPSDCPLVKCVKCNAYICSDCMSNVKGCPFNCHEVG